MTNRDLDTSQNSQEQEGSHDGQRRMGTPSEVRGALHQGGVILESLLLAESQKIIDSFKATDAARHSIVGQELTYEQFIEAVVRNPRFLIRNTCQYTADAMDSFGSDVKTILGREVRDFKVREWPWESSMVVDKKRLEGQELALNQFYEQMKLFGRREYPNRMFIFHGPPGSGKSRLNDTLDCMLEHYSERNPEGALYRLIWVFPAEEERSKFGFPMPTAASAGMSEEDSSEGPRLVYRPPGNTDPLFLLPASSDGSGPREQLLKRLEQLGRLPPTLNRDYLLRGELDTFSEELLAALRGYYREEHRSQRGGSGQYHSGVMEDILRRHVRVERYTLSRSQGRGICSVWASPNRNADLEPFYSSYAPPPLEVQGSERDLYRPTSLMVSANRGHLHFSDLFRPSEFDRGTTDTSHLNHLLNEIENGQHQIMSLRQAAQVKTEKTNLVLRADANDDLIQGKAHGPGWDSLRRRLEFIPVPHITRFLSEAAAQQHFFKTVVGSSRSICPHVLEVFSLFATATRLVKPEPSHYASVHEQLPGIVSSMSVVEKALLLQEPRGSRRIELNVIKGDERPRWNQDELGLLRMFLPKIAGEHAPKLEDSQASLYDGGFGISTATAQDFLREIAIFRSSEPISVLEVIEVLRQHSGRFGYYDKIQEAKHAHVKSLLEQRKQQAQRQGGTLSDKETQQILRELIKSVESQYPIPDPDSIIDEVERYGKRCIQDDFYFALGLASEEQSALSIRRYLEHARVSIGQPPLEVKSFYRVSSQEPGANSKLLRDFEDRIVKNEDLSSEEKRLSYRRKLFEQIGNWQAEHPNENVINNYEVIFGELVQGIRVVQKESLEKPLNEFSRMLDEYAADPGKLYRDRESSGESRQRVLEWQRAIRALEDKLGYPKEQNWITIRKNLEWALRG